MTPSSPIVHVHPGEMDNAVIDGKLIIIDPPGSADNGLLIHGGAKNLTIQNCEIVGAKRMGIDVSAGQYPGLKLLNNKVHDCTPLVPGDCSGFYLAGYDASAIIQNNLSISNGWWKGFNVNDPAQKGQLGLNHGFYLNESGSSDGALVTGNIAIDNAGSQIASRMAIIALSNVARTTFDWALIVGQLGKAPALIDGNAVFGPKTDAPPNWGSGIHLLCNGYALGNLFSGSAGTTLNPAAQDATGKVLPQLGYWPKQGTTISVPAGTRVPTIEDFCLTAYGKADPTLLSSGDAPKIIAWLAIQMVKILPPLPVPIPQLELKVNGQPWQVSHP